MDATTPLLPQNDQLLKRLGGLAAGLTPEQVHYVAPAKEEEETRMHRLLLIRHAPPLVDPTAPPRTWRLGVKGRAAALALAPALTTYAPARIITSEEAKARETGEVLAEALGVPWAAFPGLHEHERTPEDYFDDEHVFHETMREFFARPNERVFGRETGAEARKRFVEALASLCLMYPGETLGVVTHGTVMSSAVALWTGKSGYAFWLRLPLPALVVVEFPGGKAGQATARLIALSDESNGA